MSQESQLFGQGKPGQVQYEMHLLEAKSKLQEAITVITQAHYFTDKITNAQELANLQEWTRRQAFLINATMMIDAAQTIQIPKL